MYVYSLSNNFRERILINKYIINTYSNLLECYKKIALIKNGGHLVRQLGFLTQVLLTTNRFWLMTLEWVMLF